MSCSCRIKKIISFCSLENCITFGFSFARIANRSVLNLLFIVHSNIKCSSSSILLQVLQSLSILGILKYSPFSISRLWPLILILVKPLLISELLYDKYNSLSKFNLSFFIQEHFTIFIKTFDFIFAHLFIFVF